MYTFLKSCFCCGGGDGKKAEKDETPLELKNSELCIKLLPRGQYSNNYRHATYGEIKVSVQEKGKGSLISRNTCKLRSPYILTHLFEQTSNGCYIFVKESFSFTLYEFLNDPSLRDDRDDHFRVNIRDCFGDVINAVIYAKTESFYNLNIDLKTIAIIVYSKTKCSYKIMDLSSVTKTSNASLFQNDVASFGRFFAELQNYLNDVQNSALFDKKGWKEGDDILLNDVISTLSLEIKQTKSAKNDHFKKSPNQQLPTIEEISQHAFTWGLREKVDAIIRCTKILETPESDTFAKILKRDVSNSMRNWTNNIDNEVVEGLTEILREDNKNQNQQLGKSVCSLVKTVRNRLVHATSNDGIRRVIGSTDAEILGYWTDKFPYLILHIFNSLKNV